MIRRKMCESCYREKHNSSNTDGSLEIVGLLAVLQVLEGMVTVYKLADEWQEYKEKHGVGDMNLYQLRQAYKNGELDEKGDELAAEIFRQRAECSNCEKQKTLDEFSYRTD